MQALAKERGGKCLSFKYMGVYSPLRWQCDCGHIWSEKPSVIRYQSRWCPRCKPPPRRYTIGDMQEMAERKGGECLSPIYKGFARPLKWRCAKGHVWDTAPMTVLQQGSWCPDCAQRRPLTIETCQKLAAKKGGKCLSKKYQGNKVKLLWRCRFGHEWKATPKDVKNKGSWCPNCAGLKKHTIEMMREVASQRGGVCLSSKYRGNKSPLKWRCALGHTWFAEPQRVRLLNNWCPHCAGRRISIQDMWAEANMRGGFCLSFEYVDSASPLIWLCEHGHVWEAKPSSIRNLKHWCPRCGGSERRTIEEMQLLAELEGGNCLSTEYVNVATSLEWQCANGHTWFAKPTEVKNGSWCPTCTGVAGEVLERARDFARSRGGQCLSEFYVIPNPCLEWQCGSGHTWSATFTKVKAQRHFCKECAEAEKRK